MFSSFILSRTNNNTKHHRTINCIYNTFIIMARIRDTSYDKSVVYEPSEDSFLLADAVAEVGLGKIERVETTR